MFGEFFDSFLTYKAKATALQKSKIIGRILQGSHLHLGSINCINESVLKFDPVQNIVFCTL